MSDKLTSEKRSWNISRIKGKDTKIEVEVRKYLLSKGYRFRKNDKRYPGKPDIVLPKYLVAIFVHGCFWLRHEGCKDATIPKTRTEFWLEKFDKMAKTFRMRTRCFLHVVYSALIRYNKHMNQKGAPEKRPPHPKRRVKHEHDLSCGRLFLGDAKVYKPV